MVKKSFVRTRLWIVAAALALTLAVGSGPAADDAEARMISDVDQHCRYTLNGECTP
jgi:hypothetical protein